MIKRIGINYAVAAGVIDKTAYLLRHKLLIERDDTSAAGNNRKIRAHPLRAALSDYGKAFAHKPVSVKSVSEIHEQLVIIA